MNITEQSIIGDIVAQNYRYSSVFLDMDIDFCCNGGQTIKKACENRDIAPEYLIKKLSEIIASDIQDTIDYKSWPLDMLADHIQKKHHRYVESQSQIITPLLSKIAKVHKDNHPELEEVELLFRKSVEGLAMHMKKEELILFPVIRKMVKMNNDLQEADSFLGGTIKNPITLMMHEHDTEGEIFKKIATLTHHYKPPVDACNTYNATLYFLKEFEYDLHLHIHLENNILFPKAIELEEALSR